MHQKLLNICISTSPDMWTEMKVNENKSMVKVKCSRVSLIVRNVDAKLEIILPEKESERRSCLRSDLPGYLANMFDVHNNKAERQIYRILNETETGTDDILSEEAIPHASWLTKTARLPQPSPHTRQAIPVASWEDHSSPLRNGDVTGYSTSTTARQAPTYTTEARHSVPLRVSHDGTLDEQLLEVPAIINHKTDAPQYHQVIEHVRRQAKGVFWRDGLQNARVTMTSDLTRQFEELAVSANDLEPWSYPALFGDNNFTSKFRVGAAGELFVCVMTRPPMIELTKIC